MLFSSLIFLCYFLPIVLVVNYILRISRTAQNIWLFVASLFFYAWGEVGFVFVMLASILINTLLGWLVDKFRARPVIAKALVAVACVTNLGLLFVFKYLGFVMRNLNALFGQDWNYIHLTLPIGISFFTFQALSYIIDVYRDDAQVQLNPLYVGLYIAFFPQLIAGPIVRYNTIANQILYRRENWAMFCQGCCRFVTGLGRKVLLANNFAIVADRIFDLSAIGTELYVVPAALAWLGALAYTLQIFFDFSAYSDMAIGLAKMFGFELEENFNYPYVSKSIGEFWRRWHISLSTWFREYVYFPLGGSRVENQDTMVRNLFIVWMCTGVWHGSEWTFVVWGLWNFAFIMLERLVRFEQRRGHAVLKHIYLMLVVTVGWVFFRAEDLYQAFQYLGNMFLVNRNGILSDMALMFLREYGIYFAVGAVLCTPIAHRMNQLTEANRKTGVAKVFSVAYPVALCAVAILSVTYLAKGSYNPFIYFNF